MNLWEYSKMSDEEKKAFWLAQQQAVDLDDGKAEIDALMKVFGVDAEGKKKREVSTYKELEIENSEPEMTLFAINDNFFSTRDELDAYCKEEGLTQKKARMVMYIRHFAGRSDVIRQISFTGENVYLCACDEDGYGIYNRERSNREGKVTREFSEGSIADMYAAFRKRGIAFEDDVYTKIEDEDARLLELCQRENYFHSGQKSSN